MGSLLSSGENSGADSGERIRVKSSPFILILIFGLGSGVAGGLESGLGIGSVLQDIPSYSTCTPRGTGVAVMMRWDSGMAAGEFESGAAFLF